MKPKIWLVWAVVVLISFLGMELYSIFDGNEETITLTWAVVDNINPNIFFIVIGGFGAWFFWHFLEMYLKNRIKR